MRGYNFFLCVQILCFSSIDHLFLRSCNRESHFFNLELIWSLEGVAPVTPMLSDECCCIGSLSHLGCRLNHRKRGKEVLKRGGRITKWVPYVGNEWKFNMVSIQRTTVNSHMGESKEQWRPPLPAIIETVKGHVSWE